MAKRLTEFLDPKTLNITVADIASAIGKTVHKISVPKNKDWKWANMFYAIVEGEGAEFGSYRRLQCWVEAVIRMLQECENWEKLAEMIAATEAELQRYPYTDEHKQQLRVVLEEQKRRGEALKEQTASLRKAWEWAKSWEEIIKACANQRSLDVAVKLFHIQKQQYAVYQEALEWVQQIGRSHRAYLQGLEAA